MERSERDDLALAARHDYTGRSSRGDPAFRRSLNEAIDHLGSTTPRRAPLLQEWLKLAPEVAQAGCCPTWRVELESEEVAPYVTIARSAGTITQDPDLERLVWKETPKPEK